MRSFAALVLMLLLGQPSGAHAAAAAPLLTEDQLAAQPISMAAPTVAPLNLNWKGSLLQEVNFPSFPRPRLHANDPVRRNMPQELQVEPIPAPSAVSSGLMVLAGLAGVRLYRRIKLA